MKFYQNPETGEFRIVKQLTPSAFVVVKLINDRKYTVKFWRGDLDSTSKYWNTKEFQPSNEERRMLLNAYSSIMNKMRPFFSKA